jgi:adenylate cyclase
VRVAPTPLPVPDKPSIAVLPFTNLSGDPEQDYFADGIVDDILTALGRQRSLFVSARSSTFTYKGRNVDPKRVGAELGVRYLLLGSIRRAGNRVRITGRLIEAESGTQIWADRYDGASMTSSSFRTRLPGASPAPSSRACEAPRSRERGSRPPTT